MATAGAASFPVLNGASVAAETDVAIIGGGAAGIAAARRIGAAGRRVVVLEAAEQVGGRCITDTTTFGVPYDVGAHWLHVPESNPVAKLALRAGVDIYPAPPGQRVRIGRRNARESELEEYLAVVARGKRAIEDAARGKVDISCAQAMPKDLGEWQPLMEFYLGPFGCGKDFSELSATDFARSSERDVDAYCRQGFGALLAKLAEGLPVQLSTPVTKITALGRGSFLIDTAGKGSLQARAVIVTVSTNMLLDGKITFAPALPKRQLDALSRLRLGHYERIALEVAGNPFGLLRDDLVFEKADNDHTAALLANVGGTSLSFIDVAGSFGRDLAAKGPREMTAFAFEWIDKLYGADVRKAIQRTHATQWASSPFVQGSFSAASVGGQPSRRILMEPFFDRVFYAGEAAHETLWGTVSGAWESGERAADAALKAVVPVTGSRAAPTPVKRQKKAAPKKQPRRQSPSFFGTPRISND
ncbi:flavin monoamine oxidase family protein [Pseudorhodoplanes sinuspersici]|nr:NAD(P)/FAD-dependent oxidoreductase [Pseudorhodoplanes sinuspersici]RKE69135.1 monoamine oxidase [Pseudorhodoplanes sinuspersici]